MDYLHSEPFATSSSFAVSARKVASDFVVGGTRSWTRRAAAGLNALVKGPWSTLHYLKHLLLHLGQLIAH